MLAMFMDRRNGGFQDQLLVASLVCCAIFCIGCMLAWAQAILKPLVFSIILVYLLSPLIRLLTTPVNIRTPGFIRRGYTDQRIGLRLDDRNVDELIGLIEDGTVYSQRRHDALKQVDGLRVACPEWLAIILVLTIVFLMLSVVVNAFVSSCLSLQDRFPLYRAELLSLLEHFTKWLERIEPRAKDVLIESMERWLRDLPFPSIMEDTVSAIFGGLESVLLTLLFTLYLLQDSKRLSQLLVHEEIDKQLRRHRTTRPCLARAPPLLPPLIEPVPLGHPRCITCVTGTLYSRHLFVSRSALQWACSSHSSPRRSPS